jgi:prepilin-type N-terminal cleavage/methylation domain-containing protein
VETKLVNKSGFTLIEMVMYVTIIGILSLLAGGIINLGMDNYLFITGKSVLTRQAQDVMRFFHEKIILAVPDQISEAASSRFSFGTVNGDEIQFQYNQGRGYLRYRILGQTSWEEVLNGIPTDGFTFDFFSGDGSPWTDMSQIKKVRISFTIEIAGENVSYETQIYLRN